MSLKERVYSVLIVSAAESFRHHILSLLPESKYGPVHAVSDTGSARRALAQRGFDFVLINAPLPDGNEARLAADICGASSAAVLLVVRAELHEEIYDRVAPYGVFTLPKPTSRTTFATALEWMGSARERLRGTEEKTLSIEEKMEEIRLVNRAKWLLIAERGLDEPAAHRFIEKQAMDKCVSRRTIAEDILNRFNP